MSTTSLSAIIGSIIHSLSFGELELIEHGAIVYDSLGKIIEVIHFKDCDMEKTFKSQFEGMIENYTGKMIIPGFVDAHCHAPQYIFTGTGMDLSLLKWLEKYTFPSEAKFDDPDFAKFAYEKSVKRHLKCGTTFASYFATIHIEACKILVDVIHQVGQRAFVGKVSMDRNSPDFYIEETVNGCEQAENFVNHVLSLTPIGKEFLNTIQSYEKSTIVNGLTYPPKSRTISVDFSIPSTSSFANTDVECDSEIDLETIQTRARHDSIVCLASVDMHNLDVCKSYDSLHALDTSHINIETINLLKRKRSGSDYSLCLEEYNTEISIPVNPSLLLSHDLTLLNKVNTPLVMPCITPRFVPTCTSEMMSSLGHIARKYGLPVQSHMSESVNEIQWVADLHPDCDTYAGVYEKHGLLHDKVYMAHCCQSPPEERAVLARTGASAVHCASSNFMLSSGVMDVRSFLDEGIKVALGTDVAGGYSPSMLDAIRQTIVASRVKGFDAKIYNPPPDTDIIIDDDGHHENTSDGLSVSISSIGESKDVPTKPYKSLNYAEVFYLATVGGAEVLNMGDVIGNFKPNKKLDCLIVDIGCVESPIDLFGSETILQKFEKFLFLGDDRNIESVYVDGRKVL